VVSGVGRVVVVQDKIAKLLYFESSALPAGDTTSLDEYISRCDPEQQDIYYLCAPNRELAEVRRPVIIITCPVGYL
jgi:HSP90 family molecular chaperone